jgi:hypothetical protein
MKLDLLIYQFWNLKLVKRNISSFLDALKEKEIITKILNSKINKI